MLQGLKVLELANILAGPLVGQFCAELGADVIKVEQPGLGDATRTWRLETESPDADYTAYFASANWGKRSIALDIGHHAGQEVVARLAQRADIVIASYKPGDDATFGVDYESLGASNPPLIYLQIDAYGEGDDRPGFDAIIQAEAGFTYLNGEADGPPTKMPVALVDILAAHQLKEGLLLALLRRERDDKGSFVTTSLLGAATASLANQATNYLVAGVEPTRMGSEHPNVVPYGTIFQTQDGRDVVIAVGTDRQYRAFVQALDLTELADDPRFRSNSDRVAHRAELNDTLVARIASIPSTELDGRLRSRKVPFGFVNGMADVFKQPESRRQLFATGHGVRSLTLRGSIEGASDLTEPPALNQHGGEILVEAGYDRAAIEALESAGAWRPGP